MSKIVFLRIPGNHTDWRTRNPIPNLGVGFLSAVAKKEGLETVVLEGHMLLDSGYLPATLSYRERINFFLNEVERESPDIIGLSVLSGDLALGIEFAKIYKKNHPNIKIIMGGVGVNGVAEIIARYAGSSLDFIVKGEGEETLREILKEIKKGISGNYEKIKGLSFRKNKHWQHNSLRPLIQTLDSLPLMNLDDYKYLPPNIITLLPFERGCPSACHFCFATETWGSGRYFSVNRIIEQGKILLNFQKKFRTLFLSDSNILADEKLGRASLMEILKKFPEVVGSINLRVDQFDNELIKIFSHFPNVSPLMGIEALSPKMLRYLGKTNNPKKYLEDVNRVLPLIRKNRIKYCLSLIYHIPGETKEDLDLIKKFFFEQDIEKCVLIYLSRLWLEGNTQLWKKYEKNEFEIYPIAKTPSSSLGEQYNDVIFDPSCFLFKNPEISDRDYAIFSKQIRDHFTNTSCNFLG